MNWKSLILVAVLVLCGCATLDKLAGVGGEVPPGTSAAIDRAGDVAGWLSPQLGAAVAGVLGGGLVIWRVLRGRRAQTPS